MENMDFLPPSPQAPKPPTSPSLVFARETYTPYYDMVLLHLLTPFNFTMDAAVVSVA